MPPENERIANLYSNDLLCSNYFVRIFYLRVASPYLPDLDYSDYLVSQYFDIVEVCGSEMPDILIRNLPYYDHTPNTYDEMPNITIYRSASDTSITAITCNQTLDAAALMNLEVPDPAASGSIFCDALSNYTAPPLAISRLRLTATSAYQLLTSPLSTFRQLVS